MPDTLHLDPELAAKAEKLFLELGLDLPTAVHLFLRQSLRENGLPFTLRLTAPDFRYAPQVICGEGGFGQSMSLRLSADDSSYTFGAITLGYENLPENGDAFEAIVGEEGKYTMVKNDKNIDKSSKDFCDKVRNSLAQQAA